MQTSVTTKPKILRSGWGYSMCLNSFYVVLRETKSVAFVREIGSKIVDSQEGGFAGHEVPAFVENVNYDKEYRVMRKVAPDGSITYRGGCGRSFTGTLEVVGDEQKFYFNHLD